MVRRSRAVVFDLVLQPDGKLVAAGSSHRPHRLRPGALPIAGTCERLRNLRTAPLHVPLHTRSHRESPELCREISFEAQLINISDGTRSDLVVKVTALTGDNLLQNADGGPRGVGAQLTVPEEDGFADDVLSTDEFVDVPFIICLTQQQPFTFAVDVFGDVE
jgi:hypothetical protein